MNPAAEAGVAGSRSASGGVGEREDTDNFVYIKTTDKKSVYIRKDHTANRFLQHITFFAALEGGGHDVSGSSIQRDTMVVCNDQVGF